MWQRSASRSARRCQRVHYRDLLRVRHVHELRAVVVNAGAPGTSPARPRRQYSAYALALKREHADRSLAFGRRVARCVGSSGHIAPATIHIADLARSPATPAPCGAARRSARRRRSPGRALSNSFFRSNSAAVSSKPFKASLAPKFDLLSVTNGAGNWFSLTLPPAPARRAPGPPVQFQVDQRIGGWFEHQRRGGEVLLMLLLAVVRPVSALTVSSVSRALRAPSSSDHCGPTLGMSARQQARRAVLLLRPRHRRRRAARGRDPVVEVAQEYARRRCRRSSPRRRRSPPIVTWWPTGPVANWPWTAPWPLVALLEELPSLRELREVAVGALDEAEARFLGLRAFAAVVEHLRGGRPLRRKGPVGARR